jgi:hypothetical protein
MRKLIVLILTATVISGCQTSKDVFSTNATPIAVTGAAAGAIAGDLASKLVEQIGTSPKAPIKMETDSTEFATALEAALKGWGFTVITDGKAPKDAKPVELTYSILNIDGQVLVRLSTPSIALGRAYIPTAAGATPASPLSIMQPT